jgi:hypothetical protein
MLCLQPVCLKAQAGVVTGRVSLENRNGETIYGDWVRVFLTTSAVDIPAVDLASDDVPIERQANLNTAHMAFFRNVQEKLNQPGYAVDNKLSRPDGTFAFHGIAPGRYYVVVTFPTIIAGAKCAWQAPVDVAAGKDVHVELNTANMVLPAF